MSLSKFANGGSGTTDVKTTVGQYEWTIKNWRDLLSLSILEEEEDNSFYSEIFKVGETSWQIKAWPSNKNSQGEQENCLKFRLVSHNGDSNPTGTYRWKTKSRFWGTTFQKIPLMKDMMLTVGHSVFISKNLTVFVKIKVLTQIETTQKNSAGWSLQFLDDPPRKAPTDEEEDSSLYGQDKKPSPNQT